MSDQTRLEDAFRAGLQRHADDVDTTADLLGPARSSARGRRRRSWVTGSVGLAAAALVTAAVVQSVGDEPDRGTSVAEAPGDPLPTEWRTEAWHGLQVEVPADWAWGSAPVDVDGDLYRCGGPDGGEPYVGRPVMASDACIGERGTPEAPYVWLGAAIDPGEEDLGDGWVQSTVEVEGTTLTVASDDVRLRERVIGSAAPVEGCAGSVPSAPVVESMLIEGLRNPSSAQVCAYGPAADNTSYDLVYATTLGKKAAETYHSQVYDGGFESAPEFCGEGGGERVLITITGVDPYGGDDITQATVVDPGCRQVQGSPGMVTPLSDQGMSAWAQGGLPVTLSGLIGPMG